MEKFYQNMLNYVRKYPLLEKLIIGSTKYIPIFTFGMYPCVLAYLFFTNNDLLLVTIIKPLIAFVFVTVFRKIVNRKRPYETMNIDPLVKHKLGESFPSRHTVSAFAIGFACLSVNLYLGTFMLVLATIVSGSRILCGVHYISDVISAIVIALVIYLL